MLKEITEEEFVLIQNYRTGIRGVYWSVEDFESKARDMELDWFWTELSQQQIDDFKNPEYDIPERYKLYDRNTFQYALETLIEKHDCNYGITWFHIEYSLNHYCKIEDDV